ncbi:hypothetical protein BKA81DRAFT_52306 [Phyllosticta paracitricarpa]
MAPEDDVSEPIIGDVEGGMMVRLGNSCVQPDLPASQLQLLQYAHGRRAGNVARSTYVPARCWLAAAGTCRTSSPAKGFAMAGVAKKKDDARCSSRNKTKRADLPQGTHHPKTSLVAAILAHGIEVVGRVSHTWRSKREENKIERNEKVDKRGHDFRLRRERMDCATTG